MQCVAQEFRSALVSCVHSVINVAKELRTNIRDSLSGEPLRLALAKGRTKEMKIDRVKLRIGIVFALAVGIFATPRTSEAWEGWAPNHLPSWRDWHLA